MLRYDTQINLKIAPNLSEKGKNIIEAWRATRGHALLLGGCGCGCSLAPITIHDFEAALIHHISSVSKNPGLKNNKSLEELVTQIELSISPSDPAEAAKLLQQIQLSLNSLTRQHSSFSADPTDIDNQIR